MNQFKDNNSGFDDDDDCYDSTLSATSDTTYSDHLNSNKNSDNEYNPLNNTKINLEAIDKYIPQKTIPSSPNYNNIENTSFKYTPRSPQPVTPEKILTEKVVVPKAPKKRNAVPDEKKREIKRKLFHKPSTSSAAVAVDIAVKTPIKKDLNNKIKPNESTTTLKKPTNVSKKNSSSPPPPPPPSQPLETTIMEIKNDIVYINRLPKKNSFDMNTQIPLKFLKNVMQIFNKNIRTELFSQVDTSGNIWANVSIKNPDNIKFPVALFKVINIDENILENFKKQPTNDIAFNDFVLNNESDKNIKVYDENSGIITIGNPKNDKDDSIYINGRFELKKNITYMIKLSLNVIFARNYISTKSNYYKCSLMSREDNNYLLCLVLTATENHIIEYGVKLMQDINFLKK